MAECTGYADQGATSPPVVGFTVVVAPISLPTPQQQLVKRSSLLSIVLKQAQESSEDSEFDLGSDSDFLTDDELDGMLTDTDDLQDSVSSPTKPVPCPPSRNPARYKAMSAARQTINTKLWAR